MKHQVKFEKWIDPLNGNLDEVEWPGYNIDADGEEVLIAAPKQIRVLHTPIGALSMLNTSTAANNIDFWVMYTNFDITNEIKDLVKEVPGVETLEVQTRYRARLGFPKSGFFEPGQVMHNIQVAITNRARDMQNKQLLGLPMTVATKVMDVRDRIDDKHQVWALYVLPNGNVEILTTDKADKEFQQRLQLFTSAQDLIGGRLLTSEK